MKYLLSNEDWIEATIMEGFASEDKKKKADKYKQYICLFVQIMC